MPGHPANLNIHPVGPQDVHRRPVDWLHHPSRGNAGLHAQLMQGLPARRAALEAGHGNPMWSEAAALWRWRFPRSPVLPAGSVDRRFGPVLIGLTIRGVARMLQPAGVRRFSFLMT